MRLKVFLAPSTGAAMAAIRDELGPDALILGSRSVAEGVEITAACEANGNAPARETNGTAPAREAPQTAAAMAADLRWHGIPPELAARLEGEELAAALAAALRFATLPHGPGRAPLLLAGPPGAGKTMTVARLATRLKQAGETALIITADGRRAGAAEQLAAFTRLLGFTLIVADTPAQLPKALARRPAGAAVLIDMPGLNPADKEDSALLRDAASAAGGAVALVLPAGLDAAEAEDLAAGFQGLGADHLVATRLDQSRRLGGIVAAAGTGLALSEAGVNASVVDGFVPMTPQFLAQRLASATSARVRPVPLASLAREARQTTRRTP